MEPLVTASSHDHLSIIVTHACYIASFPVLQSQLTWLAVIERLGIRLHPTLYFTAGDFGGARMCKSLEAQKSDSGNYQKLLLLLFT